MIDTSNKEKFVKRYNIMGHNSTIARPKFPPPPPPTSHDSKYEWIMNNSILKYFSGF